jgi:phosphoglucomutase
LQEGNNQSVIRIENEKSSLATNVLPGSSVNVALPTAAVLICFSDDKLKIYASSGEIQPEIRLYISVHSTELKITQTALFYKKTKLMQ